MIRSLHQHTQGFVLSSSKDWHHRDVLGQISDHVEKQAQSLGGQLMVI